MVEQVAFNHLVRGSNPCTPTTIKVSPMTSQLYEYHIEFMGTKWRFFAKTNDLVVASWIARKRSEYNKATTYRIIEHHKRTKEKKFVEMYFKGKIWEKD